ncbi:tetratricopeptide repeat protein [Candidatus Desantisbacteria bacterium]|nr:tetratricopeptide repeat protein [Candidatus Desantisbacteria bacterium]
MARDKTITNPEIENYSEKLAQNPSSRVFAPLADAYRKSGMLDKAIETCMKGLNLHPNYMSAHVVLGKIYLQKEMIKNAKDEFEKVLEIDPDNLVALTMLGEIFRKLNSFNEAINKYEKILKLDPFNDNAKKALEAIRSQSEIVLKDEEIYNIYQEDSKSKKEPPRQAEKKEANYDDDINTLTMAELYYKQGMIPESKRVCKKILTRYPDNNDVKKLLQKIAKEEAFSVLKESEVKEVIKPVKDKSHEIKVDIYKEIPKEIKETEKIQKLEEKVIPEYTVKKPEEKPEQKPVVQKETTLNINSSLTGWESFIKDVDINTKPSAPSIRAVKLISPEQIKKSTSAQGHDKKSLNPMEEWLDLIKAQDEKNN